MTIPELIRQKAIKYRVDPELALRVAWQESRYKQTARSRVGAIGVFQLMPATAAELGVNPFVASENIDGGIRYLRDRIWDYGGDLYKALAAYNWGLGNLGKAIAQYGADWISHLPAETANYLAKILGPIREALPAVPSLPSLPDPGVLLPGADDFPMFAAVGLGALALLVLVQA